MRERVVVVAVHEVLPAELEPEVQVVRVALDAAREVVEHELVAVLLHLPGLVRAALRLERLDLLVVVLHGRV